MKKEYEKEYCMKCGNENPQDRDICDCGGRDFVFGNSFTYTLENGVICNCGNKKFKMTFHMNRNPIYDETYMCQACNNRIGIQTYCESQY